VQSGAFARQWIEEAKTGGKNFERKREEEKLHGIESVGAELRSRMSWV
jgi:ketol-acid reductoisomerase